MSARSVLVGNEVLAVMEFFYRNVLEPHDSLLAIMTQIKRAEQQWYRHRNCRADAGCAPTFADVEVLEVYTSASIGIASSDAGYSSAADIMRNADLAMYRAKFDGRARIAVFDQSLPDAAKHRLTLESDLRGALRNQEFLLHYQPIIALDSN